MGPFRVAILGHSMEPTLRDGDWILVLPRRRLPHPGELVVAVDPLNAPDLIVKRVTAVEGGMYRLASDSTEHREHFDERAVLAEDVVGGPWLRYAPLSRFGFVR
ncbi:MAG: S24/S26 family peptidase [Deltaproteobacteria bacterium]|nr:S24/S26 family peptidase [Deltaproteobacteria bacterium]